MTTTRAASDDASIDRLDAAVSAALSVVGKDATSQLAVLSALSALSAALPEDGVLRGLVDGSHAERQAAFVAFHERQLAAATSGTSSPDAIAATFDEAIGFTIGVDGDGDAAAALRSRKARALAGDGPPRPFFARFLEHQRR
jgi:hypothetical protein